MKKEDKNLVIDNIVETLGQYSCFYLVECSTLNAGLTSDLRRNCFKEGIKLLVVKNTLLQKALDRMEGDYSELEAALHGPTALMCSNVGNAPAKLIKNFRKKDQPLPRLKGAWVEETAYLGEDQLETLAAIKSKNELIADVVALLQSPMRNVLGALQSGANTIHGVLKTLGEREG